ncbi:MAG: N-acetyl sugar amidotransferase [Burkholderiales bacterium]|nr:N-acetyl sugar amidotransferase [Burkholderiales bacterium]MCZ2420957.1 N-acetyl sugar amidotransferase [Burkholderiales bacterium]
MNQPRTCTRCIMDTTALGIVFDEQGRCNYCSDFLARLAQTGLAATPAQRDAFLQRVRRDGEGREYDCIVGLSGGVDSSYALYLAVRNGLRPLAVHLDNGWNSELAVHNIANLVRALNVDLFTHVIDWEENRDLQLSFFKANVIDIEMLMDNAMMALNYRMARQYRVKWILAGTNRSTEGMHMPSNWNWLKFDARNIRDIHRRFGSVPISTHPLISVPGFIWNRYVLGVRWTSFLDYFDYRKDDALATLSNEVGYRPYPYKHYESVFTRFYQGYILPRKFGVDKRKLHLSTLVVTGQMTRDQALEMMSQSPYPDPAQERSDYSFVLKKLGFSHEDFESYMTAPSVPHDVYATEKPLWDILYRSHKKLMAIRRQ